MLNDLSRIRSTLAALTFAAGLAACTVDKDSITGPVAPNNDPTFVNVQSALQGSCASCHGAGSGRNYLVSMDSATLGASGFLSPTDPASSLLLRKARGAAGHAGGNVTAFSSRDSALVAAWVALLANAPRPAELSLAVAYDASLVAFRYTWKSQPKAYPVGQANVGVVYPMAYHDPMRWNGTAFAQLPSNARMDEDRVSMMIQPAAGTAPNFGNAGCYTSCHTGMASHRLTATTNLDHWHWRGGRSGPMGYAEDAAVDQTGRIRDALGVAVSRLLRSAGDRIREDQAAIVGTGHATAEGLPRFVFNRGKTIPGGYVIPRFFLANSSGGLLTDPYTQLPLMTDLSVNRSLLVAAQDLAFDGVDKVNALDVGYLVHIANRVVAHLPTHLRDTTTATHIAWRAFWAQQSGVAANDPAAAEAKLSAINGEFLASGRSAMVTRSIGFIYASDQHDVTSEASFNPVTGTWSVTLFRRLSSSSVYDADLAGLPTGTVYQIGFAMHDVGAGSETHNISLPYTVGAGATTADIRAVPVTNVRSANWSSVPVFQANWVKNDYKVTLDFLAGSGHPGGSGLATQRCQSCHVTGGVARILNP